MPTVLVRSANTGLEGAPHITITRIINKAGEQQCGFGVTDEGVEVYLTAAVVTRYNLSPLDEGAGFRARTRLPEATGIHRHPSVILPLLFDGTGEVVQIPDAPPLANPLAAELAAANTKIARLEAVVTALDELIANMRATAGGVASDIEDAVRLHNAITAIRDGDV